MWLLLCSRSLYYLEVKFILRSNSFVWYWAAKNNITRDKHSHTESLKCYIIQKPYLLHQHNKIRKLSGKYISQFLFTPNQTVFFLLQLSHPTPLPSDGSSIWYKNRDQPAVIDRIEWACYYVLFVIPIRPDTLRNSQNT